MYASSLFVMIASMALGSAAADGWITSTICTTSNVPTPVVETTTVTATPTGSSYTCSKGNTVACCDTTGGNGILGNVLGGSCLIPNLLSISNNCGAGNTFCCPTNVDGSINIGLECSPISL